MLQNVINILKILEEELKSHELHRTFGWNVSIYQGIYVFILCVFGKIYPILSP
jgi:hypothetical protein